MSTPSFIDRLRSRSRRPEQVTLLEAALPPVLETSPGPLPDLAVLPAAPLVAIQAELPEDHWHAGDPRLLPGGTVVLAGDVPSPPQTGRPPRAPPGPRGRPARGGPRPSRGCRRSSSRRRRRRRGR
ncbi:MAG: hypothetical protein PGN11_18550 [Quadrisphaera sp.]